jgi:hypothetical protein
MFLNNDLINDLMYVFNVCCECMFLMYVLNNDLINDLRDVFNVCFE